MTSFSYQWLQQEQEYFCYFFIDFLEQAYTGFGIGVLTLFYIGRIMMQYTKAIKTGNINFNIKLIYISMLAFSFVYMIKLMVSQYIFWIKNSDSFNSNASRFIFNAEILQFFFFQTIQLMVSYNWVGNIIQIFTLTLGFSEGQTHTKHQRILFNVIKYYLALRIVELISIIFFTFFNSPQILSILVKIIILMSNIQELLIVVIFLCEVYLIRNNTKLRQLLEKEDAYDMIKMYLWITLVILLRVGWSSYFSILILKIQDPFVQNECTTDEQGGGDYMFDLGVFIVKCLLQFLVIELVLRLYRVEQKNKQIKSASQTLLTDD